MVAPVWSYEPTAAQEKGVIRLKGVQVKLGHSWSKAGKLWKNFMPRQHVGSLKSHHAIRQFKVKNMECDLAVQLHIPRT